MKIGIVGGALQGMEAVYLSGKAGYETLVIDRKEAAPAISLADDSIICDVRDAESLKKAISDCDAVLPALEELDALRIMNEIIPKEEKPFLFDMHAYEISCSKEKSNNVMTETGIPLPLPWPECGFPMIVKPSCQSGSVGVSVVNNENERISALKKVDDLKDTPIQQEFVSGPGVSIEVIGNGKSSKSYVTTEILLDSNYDCKRVMCEPDILSEEDNILFGEIGTKIADNIGIKGLMDVEAINTKKGLRVLEIDARIPSQTPAAIFAATGINILEELVCSAFGKETGKVNKGMCSCYEHYVIRDGMMIACGEKEFGHVVKPRIYENMFGADELITDYASGKEEWRVTVINHGKTSAEVLEKRKNFINDVREESGFEEYIDKFPEMI